MRKIYFLVLTIFFVLFFTAFNHYTPFYSTSPVSPGDNSDYRLRIILIPLDSRPACTTFVTDLAQIANIKVILPPKELLDHYKTPGNPQALRQWLKQEVQYADAAILSIDMLVHGGLLASRQSAGTLNDVNGVSQLLSTIHAEYPQLPIYAFSIIPRLLIADNTATSQYQKSMLDYSVLKDQIYTFENPVDILKLEKLEQQIPAAVINNYECLYQQNMAQNSMLIELVDKKVITSLILGQDDGQPFGMPNITKQRLKHLVAQKPAIQNRVSITRGTDEVALTLLGQISAKLNNYQPKIFVAYADEQAPYTVMPYMPHSVATTAAEKIALVGGIPVQSPEQADFVLFIQVGTRSNQYSTVPHSAREIQALLDSGYKVALVDLSEEFSSSETVFPFLLRDNVALTKLIAYAGWNTTSNSIGTAITQATIFTATLPNMKTNDQLFALYKHNLEFLTARFLDDWYYLKEVQPVVNKVLQALNINPYQLGSYYEGTNTVISRIMQYKSQQLLYSTAFRSPLTIVTSQGPVELTVTSLTIRACLPWERTFEISLKPTLKLSLVNSNHN